MADNIHNSEPTAEDTATSSFMARFVENRHKLYAFIAKQLVDPTDVEDVFQKTSLVLWQKDKAFDPIKGSFFCWACGIAHNEVRNFLTVRRRDRLCFDSDLIDLLSEEAKEEEELSEARLAALRACVSHLPDRHQKILLHCYSGTAPIAVIADKLGRSREALHKLLARLREKLFDCIRVRLAREGIGR